MSGYRPPPLWRRPLRGLWLRPWYDALATPAVARIHMPLSHAWAAEADAARQRLESADAAWEAGFFGPAAPAPADAVRLERARRRAAAAWMLGRLRHPAAPLRGAPAAFDIAPPEVAEARHGPRLAEPAAAYPPLGARIEPSHPLQQADRTTRWLRFAAADGGTAWARLDAPPDPPKGTLVALHGVCIEEEFWPAAVDYTAWALAAGWRVLRPEAPWHGRRRLPGTYGGEPLVARGPLGFLDLFALAIPELAVWTAWARPAGPVVWSGVSLGALTAQKAAEAAAVWPEPTRPDGLFLIATAGHVAQATLDGRLGRLLRLRARLRAAGWGETELARFAPLLDPLGPAPLRAGRIGVVLGAADTLLPFGQGAALVRRWGLPAERVTVRRQGHFTISLGLLADPAPLRDLLRDIA